MIPRLVRSLLLLGLAALACLTLVYSVAKTFESGGAIDFHSYWYAGHFVREGIDPYKAYLEGLEPEAPVKYVDVKAPGQQPIAQPYLATVPANTAPVVLLLSPLAFFSWSTAKALWMLANLLFMLVIPWLVIRWLPQEQGVDRFGKAVIMLAFLGMFGTRNAAGNGQTSLFIFLCMLYALLVGKQSWLKGGIWLGIALSKYSLSFPVFIYFIYKRDYRLLLTSLAFQALAAGVLGLLTNTSPLEIVREYLRILQVHTSLPGIHLASLFPGSPLMSVLASASMTLALAIAFFSISRRLARAQGNGSRNSTFLGNHFFSALAVWTLLVAYHRAYDTFIVISFIALVVYGLGREGTWRLRGGQRAWLGWLTTLAYIPLSLPRLGITYLVSGVSGDSLGRWLDFQGGLLTLTLLAMLAGVIWLMARVEGRDGSGGKMGRYGNQP